MAIVSLLGLLGICAYEDIKKRQIEILSILIFAIFGIILHLLVPIRGIWDIATGMGIGVAMYIISILSDEKIGKGDALIITVSGIYLGFWENLILLWGATGLCSILGILLLITGRRNKEIPFVPFLLITYIVILAIKEVHFV